MPRTSGAAAVIREELQQKLNVASGDFVEAPAIYCFNVPRYWTILLRAREYAKKKEYQLSWCVARDVPLCRHDRDLDEEQLHTKRCIWLGRHDQDTAHLTSLLPLVQGLPLRLTETVNRKLRLYRGRRCRLLGWAPHPEDVRTEVDGEWVSTKLPLCLYLYFPGATWKLHDDLEEGVYPLVPASRTWKVNKNTGVQARRTGFFYHSRLCIHCAHDPRTNASCGLRRHGRHRGRRWF